MNGQGGRSAEGLSFIFGPAKKSPGISGIQGFPHPGGPENRQYSVKALCNSCS